MSKFSIALLVSALSSLFWGEPVDEKSVELDSCETVAAVWEAPDSPPGVYSVDGDTTKTKNPNDRIGDPTRQEFTSPLHPQAPGNLQVTYELAEDGSGYYIYEKMGGVDVRRPSWISFEDYLEYRKQRGISDYYKEKSMAANEEAKPGLIPTFELGKVSDIFGGGTIEIRPTGFVTLNFSLDRNKTENPSLPLRQQRVTTFNFDQQIQLGVVGKIGEALRLNATFDTKATFDFENQLKLEHNGTEDQILQKIEAGNVSLPLGNSLIQGRQNLFGLKTGLKFGPVNITAVASTERGQVETISVAGGGAIETPFEQEATLYDEYKHFFLGHYFRNHYEDAMSDLPNIRSRVRINRIEVWINNNRGSSTVDNRNALGFIDLGENSRGTNNGVVFNPDLITNGSGSALIDNDANDLYGVLTDPANIARFRDKGTAPDELKSRGFDEGLDFQLVFNMRKLLPTEFNYDQQLGYISLNQKVAANQVIFVAFEYTLDGKNYQVGEFSNEVPSNGSGSNVLFLKMLKPGSVKPTYEDSNGEEKQYPAWDLMMKNIYNIGYGIERENFFLDVTYNSGTSAGQINFLPTGPVANQQLIQVMNLDKLTNHTAPGPDNYFDFIEGRTILSDKGQVIFPVLEPFGDHLRSKLEPDVDAVKLYVFDLLYDGTQQDAIQKGSKYRYKIQGYYRSSGGADIPLNTFNLSEGSVTVTAGGRTLTEGSDYIVDYFGGKLTIINEAILTSGQKIDVSYESSSLYNVQTKTLVGARAEYSPTDEIALGLTALHLSERPFTQKTTLGDEPTSNTLWGIDAAIRKESMGLTKFLDKLPLLSTKQASNITAQVEGAQFVPGQPRQIRTDRDDSNVYLDDFEAAKTPFSLQGALRWKLASLPKSQEERATIPIGLSHPDVEANLTRGRLAWYTIDQALFQGFQVNVPDGENRKNYTRMITPNEIFPTATRAFGATIQQTFDLHYIPTERGPYNYSTNVNPATGELLNPKDNWAGITRQVDVNNDFEATNVEFLEFWLMDPFMNEPNHTGGQLYFNLGLVSEDVLPDRFVAQENGLPKDPNDVNNIDSTAWGRVPIGLPANQNFSNNSDERTFQDVGLDGLSNENEANYFFFDNGPGNPNFLQTMQNVLTNQDALQALQDDPSSDDFLHFRDEFYENRRAGILERYLKFNGTEGNSPVSQGSTTFAIQATQEPDNEDLNRNGSLTTNEEYYEYRVDLNPSALVPGSNFVVDSIQTTVVLDNNTTTDVRWFQFRIPLMDNTRRPVGGISNLKSVDFVRMYLTGFEDSVILRMTEFQLVATQWRRFPNENELAGPCPVVSGGADPLFEIGSVSIEENSQKTPFNYVLPPGIERQAINGNTQAGFLQDERALLLRTQNLANGDARAVFKTVNVDLRNYERLKLWTHGEAIGVNSNFIDTGDATVFLRLGLDNEENYYEYEMPLTPSDPQMGSGLLNVWPESNEMDVKLGDLTVAKAQRDLTGAPPGNPFYFTEGLPKGHKITILGTPVISNVRNIVIGVRNPRPCGQYDPNGNPIPQEPVSVELWVNELRLTDFEKTSGWAANANLNLDLADFGNIQASISNRTVGFGALEQRISERSQENTFRYDIAGNFSMGKLFPKKWGIQMPVFVNFGEQRINPKFDPRQPDVRTKDLIEGISDRNLRDSALQQIQDYTRNRSISFNNVKKVKNPNKKGGKSKTHFWDIENFDFTFAYNEQFNRSAFLEKRLFTNHQGAINYRYAFAPVSIKPFKNWKRKNPLSQFNFSPLPNSVSFNLNGNRLFEERQLRSANSFGGNVDPTFTKNFLLNRAYNLSWNLTESITFNFTANNISRVDEVRGYWATADSAERDSIGTLSENLLKLGRDTANGHDNLINFGRSTEYNHNFSLTYQLPFNKYTWTNFLNGNINYAATFRRQQAPENNQALGGVISNGQNIQANGRVDLKNLYTKFKPIKNAMDAIEKRRREKERARRERQNAKKQAKDGKGKPAGPVRTPARRPEPQDSTPVALKILKDVGNEFIRMILSVQSVDMNYTRNASTILPGYMPTTDNLGLDFRYDSPFADSTLQSTGALPPTFGFIAGSQKDIREIAGQNGWISRDTALSNFFAQNYTEQFSGRTSVELFKGFRIDINFNRNRTENTSELFSWSEELERYSSTDRLLNGTFNMSYIFLNTAFEKNEETVQSFDDFANGRADISQRLYERNPHTDSLTRQGLIPGTEYFNGYSGENQDVLLPSLLAAYGPFDAKNVGLSSFPKIPLPNWSINYNGLNNLPGLKNVLNSLTIRHTYRASYSVAGFTNNLNARVDSSGIVRNAETKINTNNNQAFEDFYSATNIQTVSITEQFAPLIGFQMNWKNGVTSSIDYKKNRNLNFSTGTLQLTEQRNEDLSVMIGYRKDKLNWSFRLFGKDIELKNSMNAQFRLTMSDQRTRNRTLDSNLSPDYTQGSFNMIIEPAIDYVVNTRLNLRFFYKQNLTRPYTSNTYKTSFSSGGIQIRYALSN